MEQLPHHWPALIALVFALGLRHGFDADHLAAIDGLSRRNSLEHPRLARYCGVLFSLGHGAVVIVAAATASLAAGAWAVPEWMEALGALFSILFLTLLGCANLMAVISTPSGQAVRPAGIKGRLLGRWQQAGRPAGIVLVGALFALSFDTLSQAALFALGAGQFGDWRHAAGLGGVFMLGMLATDGINGLWVWRLLRRADRTALIASRVMGLVLAGLSLAVAALGAVKFYSPWASAWLEGSETWVGLAAILVVGLAYVAGMRVADWRGAKTA